MACQSSCSPQSVRRALPALIVVALIETAIAGEPQPARPHVMLPPAFGGTPLSFQIEAEAHYLAARGDLIESVAIARKIHAEAVAQEIQNSVDAVDAYFKRRELNQQWRAKENPDNLQYQQKLRETRLKRLETQFQDVLKGDVTAYLNWLLTEVSGPALAYQYFGGSRGLNDSELNARLDPQTVKLLWLSDGGRSGGKLVFSATEPKVLQAEWPPAVLDPQFAELRSRFESERDALLATLRQKRQASNDDVQSIVKCIDDLLVALERAYPAERRKEGSEFLTYHAAKRYLRSLLAQVHRVAATKDSALLDGSLQFQGGRLLDLIAFMDRTGLVFAPPPPGAERAYGAVITDMRNLSVGAGQGRRARRSKTK